LDQDAYDDLLQRLTALVIKMDESLDELKEFNRQQVGVNTRLDASIDELKAFNREQVATNQRLETLLERAWRSSPNGHTD
jgi:cell fate (sporulation/competence/biofilm development) regulator YmcA (YheA/YmcA/DUF963 family)